MGKLAEAKAQRARRQQQCTQPPDFGDAQQNLSLPATSIPDRPGGKARAMITEP